jgi:hypothetical protein
MRTRATLSLALASWLAGGCQQTHDADAEKGPELPDVGIGGASDAPPPGLDRPIARGDLRRVAEVGRWLHAAERAVQDATAHAVTPRGTFEGDLVLPLVDVDPGGTSAQVIFVRWPGAAAKLATPDDPPRVEAGERWLMVSLLLEGASSKVLDTQVLHDRVVPASDEGVRVAALLAAAVELRRVAPGHAFLGFDRRLVAPPPAKKKDAARTFVTAVYALAVDGGGPDLEIVVDFPRKKGLPAILRHDVVHTSGAFERSPIELDRPEPCPLTVARALRHPDANVMVHATDGRYEVSGRTGAIERLP